MKEFHDLFIDVRTKVPGTDKEREKYADAHVAYLNRLREEGKLPMSGPFKDGSGGLLIFNASSLEEAVGLAGKEPLVANGIEKSNVKAWTGIFYGVTIN